MKKKLLFKAIKKGTDTEWVYGTPIVDEGKNYIAVDGNIKDLVPIDEDTLCEYTNRNMCDDKKEIFENDIILVQGDRWVVRYCNAISGFQGYCTRKGSNGEEYTEYSTIFHLETGKIVGNEILESRQG